MKRDDLAERLRRGIVGELLHAVADTGEADDGSDLLRDMPDIPDEDLKVAGLALAEMLADTGEQMQHGYESCTALNLNDLSDQLHERSCCDTTVLAFSFGIIFAYFEAKGLGYSEVVIAMQGALDHYVSITEDRDMLADMPAPANTNSEDIN